MIDWNAFIIGFLLMNLVVWLLLAAAIHYANRRGRS